MEKIDRFNIRVYGLLINKDALLILKEPYANEVLYKFPGGGVEFGEGIIQALKRELKEELNLDLFQHQHFYTQEEFVQSKFKTNEQLLTIYYLIEVSNLEAIEMVEKRIEKLLWIPFNKLTTENVNLPVDKIVVEKLLTNAK